jgi:hypothetical protein
MTRPFKAIEPTPTCENEMHAPHVLDMWNEPTDPVGGVLSYCCRVCGARLQVSVTFSETPPPARQAQRRRETA